MGLRWNPTYVSNTSSAENLRTHEMMVKKMEDAIPSELTEEGKYGKKQINVNAVLKAYVKTANIAYKFDNPGELFVYVRGTPRNVEEIGFFLLGAYTGVGPMPGVLAQNNGGFMNVTPGSFDSGDGKYTFFKMSSGGRRHKKTRKHRKHRKHTRKH